jgi:uncharacterized membrane protein
MQFSMNSRRTVKRFHRESKATGESSGKGARLSGGKLLGGTAAQPEPGVDELTRRNIDTIARIERASDAQRTLGERLADGFATMVGSWTFIIIQTVLLAVWVVLNLLAWSYRWDPYPFILLNLALSFQAAYAGPIIMMSQNRQMKLSDRRNHLDLQINLLAEQENTEMLRLLRKLCEASHISIDESGESALEKDISAAAVLQQIERTEGQTRPNGDKQ